jgi:hypothetical protein
VFEVKATAKGVVGKLSARQKNMAKFLTDVLSQASKGAGRYKKLDTATRSVAKSLFDQFLADPKNVSGSVIGVDLLNQIITISRW